jgi:hypothetical protein
MGFNSGFKGLKKYTGHGEWFDLYCAMRHLCCVLVLALTGVTVFSHCSDAQWMFLNHADAGLMNIPLLLDLWVHNRNYETTLLDVSSQETSM